MQEKEEISQSQDEALRNLLDSILTAHSTGRRLNAESLAKARGKYKKLTKNMSRDQIKNWLREKAQTASEGAGKEISVRHEQAMLVEEELKSAVNDHKSALNDRPYIEKLGRNDFLVMNPDVIDSFVTVVPNAIYYNIEKKCVNWLDDCSLKGIRARLLRGVQSP